MREIKHLNECVFLTRRELKALMVRLEQAGVPREDIEVLAAAAREANRLRWLILTINVQRRVLLWLLAMKRRLIRWSRTWRGLPPRSGRQERR